MKHFRSLALALTASAIIAASCVTSSEPLPPAPPTQAPPPAPAEPPPPSEEDIIQEGVREFAKGDIAAAQRAWSTIPGAEARGLYLSYSQDYATFADAVAGAEKALSAKGPEAALEAVKGIGSGPTPPDALAEGADPLEAVARLDRVAAEAAGSLAARASEAERAADADLEYARAGKGKDPITSADKALQGFSEAGRLYRGSSEWIPESDTAAERADAKAAAAEETRKRLIKESLLSFPERMGEVFARAPQPSAKLSDKELLAFNAETAAIISGGLSDFDRIVAQYPDILDPSTIAKLRDTAKGLSVRFTRIESTIRAVKDRGKPLIPLIIGIFNPQPGDPQRSRPAAFAGSLAAGSDWWWGIADIPKSVAQDLVITMSDSRPVRVYAAGVGAGSKPPASDLVNPLFKVGNSWPVLNAGARLVNGVFHIEVGPSKARTYSGEAVVYKSFMTRTR
jgi:hypothetical protein